MSRKCYYCRGYLGRHNLAESLQTESGVIDICSKCYDIVNLEHKGELIVHA